MAGDRQNGVAPGFFWAPSCAPLVLRLGVDLLLLLLLLSHLVSICGWNVGKGYSLLCLLLQLLFICFLLLLSSASCG